jgi:hypothetical protein
MRQRRRESHLSGLKAFPKGFKRPLSVSLAAVVVALVIIELAISKFQSSNHSTIA